MPDTILDTDWKITRDPKGYYTLQVNGRFMGNFDSAKEAYDEFLKTMQDIPTGSTSLVKISLP